MALEKNFKDIIVGSSKAAAAAALPATVAPGLDIPAIAAIWGNMMLKIAKECGRKMDSGTAFKLATIIASGVSGYMAGCKLFTWGLLLIPGIGWLGAMGLNATLNYVFTYKFGKIAKSMFERPSFDVGDAADMAKLLLLPLLSFPGLAEIREMV
jgi:uncharacterized protein (DUF697 family)